MAETRRSAATSEQRENAERRLYLGSTRAGTSQGNNDNDNVQSESDPEFPFWRPHVRDSRFLFFKLDAEILVGN